MEKHLIGITVKISRLNLLIKKIFRNIDQSKMLSKIRWWFSSLFRKLIYFELDVDNTRLKDIEEPTNINSLLSESMFLI